MACYSKQKSKPNLVKTDDCDSKYFGASDVEDAVIAELFRMTYLGNEDKKKSATYIDPSESLAGELKEAKRKLSRLYDLDDEMLVTIKFIYRLCWICSIEKLFLTPYR